MLDSPTNRDERLVLVTKSLSGKSVGGRELLCKLNRDILYSLYGDKMTVFELPDRRLNGLGDFVNAFRGHIDGLNGVTIEAGLRCVRESGARRVFLEGSNLGGFVAALKQRLPNVEVITFFHNVEARFFWGALRSRKSPHALGVFLANYLAERNAVRWSDKLICLSDRDSRLLQRLYGRGATHISAMALEDKLPALNEHSLPLAEQPFALFVGGTFYANQLGISWFVRLVSPHIDLPIFVVGRGFDALREELEIPGKVTVIGEVDSLAEWYRSAAFIIAPIFDGSGMKTKVAEALMHGKMVIGTPEAFSGYEEIAAQAGWVCHTADEFIAAIAAAQRGSIASFDQDLRDIYLRSYSIDAARRRMADILI